MAQWSEIVNTTITNHLKKRADLMLRNRKLTAGLQAKGRIVYNVPGQNIDWPVEYKRQSLRGGVADMSTSDYSRINRHKKASLDWAVYEVTDAVSEHDLLKNRGAQAQAQIWDKSGKKLETDFKEQFADEFYIDGNATGNTGKLQGIESFMGYNSAISNSFCRAPNDTYAGLSTVLGNYGGDWTTGTGNGWPAGAGDTEYEFWSPMIVDASLSAWSSPSADSWATNAPEVLRYAIVHTQRNDSRDSRLDWILLTREHYRQFTQLLSENERVNIERGADQALMTKLGFGPVTWFEGVEVNFEYFKPLPSDGTESAKICGYGWNLDRLTLHCQTPELIKIDGPDFKQEQSAYIMKARFYGQLQFETPRSFLKITNAT